jgi:hypothetical protein
MSLTVICHIWNEEFFLPFWIRHHKLLFDSCIFIDYGSTDRSLEIIADEGKDWATVRPTRNAQWGAIECDSEVMDIEETIPGWKIALNVTEFYVCSDLKTKLSTLPDDVVAVKPWGGVGIDPKDCQLDILPNLPLLFQCHYGAFHHHDSHQRERLLHRAPRGEYTYGRHTSHLPNQTRLESAFCIWLQFTPYQYVRERKLRLESRIPQEDRDRGFGLQHWKDIDRMDEFYERDRQRYSHNLFDEAAYKNALIGMYRRSND